MGNLFSIFGGNANARHKGSFKKASKHSKRNTEHTDVHSNGSIKTRTDDHQPNIDEPIMDETNQSPFKRDFYPPPHEMLVPLEKYRPRRSNVRRSTRQNVSITASNNSTSSNNNSNCNNNHNNDNNDNNNNNNSDPTVTSKNESNNKEKLYENGNVSNKNDNEQLNCDESFTNKIPSLMEEDENEAKERIEMDEGEVKMENNTPSLTYIDKLDPSERTKLARSKISELFNKVPPTMARNSSLKDRKYQSVYEPSIEHYMESVDNDSANNHQGTISGQNDHNDNDCILRPKKPHIKGNALLIDELKKRQTNYYESRQSSVELTN